MSYLRRRLPVLLFWTTFAVVFAAFPCASIATAQGDLPTLQFDWSVPPRFPTDTNGDGVIDENHSPSYVNPAGGYRLQLNACGSQPGSGSTIVSYGWRVTGDALETAWEQTVTFCAIDGPLLPQGNYTVSLTVTDADSASNQASYPVTIKDYLIVSIGDSYSSGEGNPDHPGDYSYGYWVTHWFSVWPARWMNEQCHRSSYAGSMQAARRIEETDPHTSVTFVFVVAAPGPPWRPDCSDRMRGPFPAWRCPRR